MHALTTTVISQQNAVQKNGSLIHQATVFIFSKSIFSMA